MYYMNTPPTPQSIMDIADGLGYDIGMITKARPDYMGFNHNGKFIYTDRPSDFGDRPLHCTTEAFIKALRTFTPQSIRPMAPEVI